MKSNSHFFLFATILIYLFAVTSTYAMDGDPGVDFSDWSVPPQDYNSDIDYESDAENLDESKEPDKEEASNPSDVKDIFDEYLELLLEDIDSFS